MTIMIDKNTEYIEGLQRGDKKVFGELFNAFYEPLCRYCLQKGMGRESAEEIVQDVFVKIWIRRESLKVNTSISAYLYRMVLNTLINQKKHQSVRADYQAHVLAFRPLDADQGQAGAENEIRRLAADAVAGMPEKRRMVYELSRKEGLKYSEIATAMGISVKTVEAHLSAALEHMRRHLKDYLPICFLVFLQIG